MLSLFCTAAKLGVLSFLKILSSEEIYIWRKIANSSHKMSANVNRHLSKLCLNAQFDFFLFFHLHLLSAYSYSGISIVPDLHSVLE